MGEMTYRIIDGKPVSQAWYDLLTTARRQGVYFRVNSGHRTMAEQWYLYNGWRRGLPGFNRAAYPSPFAPHIRAGQYHAIDFDGSQNVINFAARHGVTLRRTVSGESWHLEGTGFAGKFHPGRPTLHPGDVHKSVQTLKWQLIHRGYQKRFSFSWLSPFAKKKYTASTAVAVKAFQREHGLVADGIVGPKTWAAFGLR